jgi:hypothetical protein
MDTDKLVDALSEMIAKSVDNAIDDVNIADKVHDAIEEVCWDEVVRDKVDFGDLVRENADFDTAAADAIDDHMPSAIDKHLASLDWRRIVAESADVTEMVRERIQKEWVHHQGVVDSHVEQMVEDKLTGNFHDIDRDLDERVCRAVGPLIDRIQTLEAKLAKPWWGRIFG